MTAVKNAACSYIRHINVASDAVTLTILVLGLLAVFGKYQARSAVFSKRIVVLYSASVGLIGLRHVTDLSVTRGESCATLLGTIVMDSPIFIGGALGMLSYITARQLGICIIATAVLPIFFESR